jgi:hypothetical protein
MNPPKTEPVEYLGDGAYVRYTGYSFIIFTSNGLTESNHVHLEDNELKALDRFRERIKNEAEHVAAN